MCRLVWRFPSRLAEPELTSRKVPPAPDPTLRHTFWSHGVEDGLGLYSWRCWVLSEGSGSGLLFSIWQQRQGVRKATSSRSVSRCPDFIMLMNQCIVDRPVLRQRQSVGRAVCHPFPFPKIRGTPLIRRDLGDM